MPLATKSEPGFSCYNNASPSKDVRPCPDNFLKGVNWKTPLPMIPLTQQNGIWSGAEVAGGGGRDVHGIVHNVWRNVYIDPKDKQGIEQNGMMIFFVARLNQFHMFSQSAGGCRAVGSQVRKIEEYRRHHCSVEIVICFRKTLSSPRPQTT